MAMREFYVIIERDEDGYYVGEVPQLRACYSQGRTLDELMANMREVIELCFEEEQGEEILSSAGACLAGCSPSCAVAARTVWSTSGACRSYGMGERQSEF